MMVSSASDSAMNCIICGSPMHFYFSKRFEEFGLGTVNYWQCPRCGFCASKTHFDMTSIEWSDLNEAFHSRSHARQDNPYNRNQRYFNQALMLHLMAQQKLIRRSDWLDWGCGVGAVAKLLDRYFGIELSTYDKYYTPEINAIAEAALVERSFDLVVNTAVFEHVRDRRTLDEIESFVAPGGCLAIHTLVPESVPRDPEWMYLLPVHCAFHTNRSMQMLMGQWGYSCSVYNEHSKLWVLFREPSADIRPKVDDLNERMGWQYLHFKDGFMDYWK